VISDIINSVQYSHQPARRSSS